ncbi:MAG: GAF domain-containing protein [Actinobacteria bacterium]|nr:MAG: GAF domain-containing protein [Actinomycetota bacterium]
MVTRRGDASRRTNDRQDLDDERRARIEAEATSRRLAFVLGASQLLAKSLDLDETLGSLVRLAVPTLADLCIIDLVAPGGSLRRAAVAHADPTVASTARQTMMRYTPDPAGGHPVAEVLRTGHPVLVGDVSSELAEEPPVDSHHLSVVRELGVRSYMVVPLVARGSTIGTVMLESTSEERRFGPGDVALAEDVARSAALAIDTAQLMVEKDELVAEKEDALASARLALDRERAARRDAEMAELRLGVLAEASSVLSSALDPGVALNRLAHLVIHRLADWCAVDLLADDGRVRRVAVSSADPADLDLVGSLEVQTPREPTPGSPLDIVRHHEGPVLFRETRAEELASASHAPEGARPYRGPRLRSGVVVPLAGRVHLLGALTMAWAGSERHFDEGDLPMAADLGRRAGLALENARLYEEKRNAAETLQRALLPSEPPAVPGLTTAVRYVAATSGAEVGGDWYEVMTLADGRVGIAVGDAMGHGVEAAAVMGTVRNALRSHAWSGANPAEVVRKLDEFVSGAESAHLATVLYAAYDPSTQVLRWMNAGHPPPLLVGPGPVVQFLDGGHRTMLGLNVGGDDEGKITLPSGATLLLYTDGLIEERASSLDEGLDRLSKAAAAHSDAEPAELLDEILQPLLAHAQLEDDVAVLAARVDPS